MQEIKIRHGEYTSIGNYRDNNEDRMWVDLANQLYMVADGMGGQAAGEQASQIAIEVIPQSLKSIPTHPEDNQKITETIHQAVMAANDAILARGLADPSVQNMGTTVVAALIRDAMAYIASIGDSRCYLLRDGKINAVTTDHNLAEALYAAGTITKEELKTHRFKNVLYRYLGNQEAKLGPDIIELPIKPNDRLLLATDGLCGVVEDKTIGVELAKYNDPQKCAEVLVKLALDRGSKDNVTCIVLFVDKA